MKEVSDTYRSTAATRKAGGTALEADFTIEAEEANLSRTSDAVKL